MLKKTIIFAVIFGSSTMTYAGNMLSPLIVDDMQETDCIAKAVAKNGDVLASVAEDARIKLNGKVISLSRVNDKSKNSMSFKGDGLDLMFKYTGKTKDKKIGEAIETTTPANMEFKGTLTPVILKAICM